MNTAIPLSTFALASLYVFLYSAQSLHAYYFRGALLSFKRKLESSCALASLVGILLLITLGIKTAWYEPFLLLACSVGTYFICRRVGHYLGRRMYYLEGSFQSTARFLFGNTCVLGENELPELGLATIFVSLFAFAGWPLAAFLIWRSIDGLGPL